jgi:guanine deaminase
MTHNNYIMSNLDNSYLEHAVRLARENVARGGGPFGAVIVKDGEVVAESANQVTSLPDPTAHAEILAIRQAAARLNTYDLSGTVLYSSCEPCPMCLGAIYWARIGRVVYASDRHDAGEAGFRDADLYSEITLYPEDRHIPFEQIRVPGTGKEFEDWKNTETKTPY